MYDNFLFFRTPPCPNCGEIHDWLEENAEIAKKGEEIDASTPEGLAKAREHGITGVPTIIFLKDGKEVARAEDIEEFQKILENKSLSEF